MLKTLKNIYEKKYKLLMIIPALMLLLGIIQLGSMYASTGEFISKGISLKGGIKVTTDVLTIDAHELEDKLTILFGDADVRTLENFGQITGFEIDASVNEDQLTEFKEVLGEYGITNIDDNLVSIDPVLGDSFFRQTFKAMIIAFILMSVVVYFYFRKFVPSFAVILAIVSDIIVTAAIVNIFDFKIGMSGIAAFLMLIGYSVDTDILLSTRVLKREGEIMNNIYSALKTGMTMTGTTLVALIIGSLFIQSPEIKQIMFILIIGLVVDIINTWIQNVGILRWYLKS